MIQVKSIRWGANVELRGRESQRRIEGDGILYDEHTGNVEVDDGGCRAIVVPPQGSVIVLGERLQVGEVETMRDRMANATTQNMLDSVAAQKVANESHPARVFVNGVEANKDEMHPGAYDVGFAPARKAAIEPPRSPASPDPPPARPIKARR